MSPVFWVFLTCFGITNPPGGNFLDKTQNLLGDPLSLEGWRNREKAR
jgi:hypothetical protein